MPYRLKQDFLFRCWQPSID